MREDYEAAFCVMTFDRPEYTHRCIASLQNCVDKDKVDWHLFQDGAVNKFSGIRRAEDRDIEVNTQVLHEADLPNKTIHVNQYNLGTAYQRDKIWELFDDKYDLIITIESDAVVSKYFVRQYLSLMEQFNDMVGTMYGPGCENKMEHLNEVIISGVAIWINIGLWEHTYRIIEDRFDDFMQIVAGQDFWPGHRPSKAILEEFQTDEVDIAAGIDGVVGQLFRDYEIPRVKPRVSRCANIGRQGMNTDPDRYDDNKFGDEFPIEFEEDRQSREWEVYEVRWPFGGEEPGHLDLTHHTDLGEES